MRSLDHENIIKLQEVYESSGSVYLVMELAKGRSLQTILEDPSFSTEYSDEKIINILSPVLNALSYLASKGIMHRDLKPDNIMVDEETGALKIMDFGLATKINIPEYIYKICGTPGYIAPEVFNYNKNVPSTGYNDKCDVFSVGCILFFM